MAAQKLTRHDFVALTVQPLVTRGLQLARQHRQLLQRLQLQLFAQPAEDQTAKAVVAGTAASRVDSAEAGDDR